MMAKRHRARRQSPASSLIVVALDAQRPLPPAAGATPAAAADAGDPEGLSAGDRGAAAEAGRRRLADDPPHLRRLGLQPARPDHRRQRRAAAAGVDRSRPAQTNGHEAPPIVNNGVMFVVDAGQPGDRARREDRRRCSGATDGRCPKASFVLHPTSRGVALYGDKVYFAAGEAVLVALDARTGKEVWTTTVADNKSGYYMTLAPLVADGKVMVGASGGEFGVRGFVAAYDAETGQASCGRPTPCPRRASPAARRGRRAISGRPAARRSGSPATTIPRPTSRSGAPATAARGWATSGPATTSTPRRRSRIDVATGQIKGHFQYHPNESWDWDEVSPPILVDYQRNGRTIKGLINVARNGYLWFLERTDGPINFVEGKPYVKQNVFRSLDPKTGRPDVDPARKPGTGKTRRVLPVALGRQELAADRLQPEDADDLHPGQREPVRHR